MDRRTMLKGGTIGAAVGLFSNASTAEVRSDDIAEAVERFRASIPSDFNSDYVERAVIPYFLTSIYEGERPALPMIDTTLTKENALPVDLRG